MNKSNSVCITWLQFMHTSYTRGTTSRWSPYNIDFWHIWGNNTGADGYSILLLYDVLSVDNLQTFRKSI